MLLKSVFAITHSTSIPVDSTYCFTPYAVTADTKFTNIYNIYIYKYIILGVFY